MAIEIAISIFDEDRDCNRDLNFGDRGQFKVIFYQPLIENLKRLKHDKIIDPVGQAWQ